MAKKRLLGTSPSSWLSGPHPVSLRKLVVFFPHPAIRPSGHPCLESKSWWLLRWTSQTMWWPGNVQPLSRLIFTASQKTLSPTVRSREVRKIIEPSWCRVGKGYVSSEGKTTGVYRWPCAKLETAIPLWAFSHGSPSRRRTLRRLEGVLSWSEMRLNYLRTELDQHPHLTYSHTLNGFISPKLKVMCTMVTSNSPVS